jgi:hypothetical protein
MPQIIDMAEVQATMEALRERSKAALELPGFAGVTARLQDAVVPEMTYWRARELNRGTQPALMVEAMVAVFAASFAGEFRQYTDSTDAQFELANEVISSFANALGNIILTPQKFAADFVIPAKDVGHA